MKREKKQQQSGSSSSRHVSAGVMWRTLTMNVMAAAHGVLLAG
jgi:hypothetical protein